MQTTLLTLAVAVILALVAALVGPFFIDWGSYRSLFEQEAGRLTGLDVRVRGQIDARLLPSPRLQLNDIQIGKREKVTVPTRTGGHGGGDAVLQDLIFRKNVEVPPYMQLPGSRAGAPLRAMICETILAV